MATNIVYKSGEGGIVLRLTVGSGVVSGDVVEFNDLHGLAITSYSAVDGKADILLPGVMAVADVPVEAVDDNGTDAVAVGSKIYYDTAATIKLNRDAVNGKHTGYALEAIGAGESDTINVALTN